MDAKRFDQFAQSLSTIGTRRGVLACLAALPLAGALQALLGAEEGSADGSGAGIGGNRRRHKNRVTRRRRGNANDRKPRKQKKKCKPEAPAQTCAERCGTIKNNCQQPVDCGPCACGSECCAGACCPASDACLDGSCCTRNCPAVACGSGAPQTCGVVNCGTCSAGQVCIDGACDLVCPPGACPQACLNCLASPAGTRLCVASTASSCSAPCRDDSDCCPGEVCAADPTACAGQFVCYVLGSPCD